MKFSPSIRRAKAFFAALLIVLVSLGLAVPAQAIAGNASPTQMGNAVHSNTSGMAMTRSNEAMDMDCCDDQSCPDHMDCGGMCLSHCTGLSVFVIPPYSVLLRAKMSVTAPKEGRWSSASIQIISPPPRV